MKLPLPDFQKDIKVGDLSFVYKGVFHPIHWEGDMPYRPRVENIVVRNGREIFLRVYDNPKPGFEYRYRLPGGSLDNDSTKIQQAENETNEEALLKVKNIQYSGIKYFEQFPEGHLLKGGDICLEYKGSVTDVFVSEYNGKFDKTKVEEHDLDDDMANNGKFYHISLHCRILRPEHVDALLRSDLVDDNVKSIMRRVLRGDIEATKKVKDSDMYTELIPNSIVTESSNVHELESVDISSRIFHGSPTQNIKEVKAFHNDRIYSDLGPVIFCSEYKNFAGCYGTRWNDKTMKLYTSFDEGRLSAVSIAVLDKEIMNEWNKPCSLYELENDGNFKRLPNHPCEIINPNSVKVKKEIKFNNFYEMIKACNIEVRIGDDNGLVSVATEASTRSKLPDSAFGIPEERKYELDTKKHVLSAIKLFNWVEDKYEKELARNILKKIDEFDIKEDEIHMTEKNRFYKYYYKTGDGK